ncbi:MAG: shikimate kinase [Candidatus Omnitrophota bacterium]
MNITLIGMPGAGKSSIGRTLASKLGFDFLDTDNIIEKRAKFKLQKIIDKYGEATFLDMEQQAVIGLGKIDNCVICPGGSVVYSHKAMSFLKENSVIVFLEADLECLKEHISDISTRGIVGLKGKDLEDVYQQRRSLYEKYADVTLKLSQDLTIMEHVECIIKSLPCP